MYYCLDCNKIHDVQVSGVIFKTGFRCLSNGEKVQAGKCKPQQKKEHIFNPAPTLSLIK
jgi:hypothetical protein